jgi:LysR family transcriptional regulator, flagellar master operon regulator
MNLEELRTFLAIVETGSLVAASRRLYVTQSTVTARMNALEEELGQKLLHRVKSGAELTSPGFQFKRYAEVMVQLWRQACHEIALPEGFSGVSNVGLEFDLWHDLGQRFLQHIKTHCPGIAVALWPGTQVEVDRWLRTGLIDLAFCFTPQASEKFASRVLLVDEIVLLTTTGKTASSASAVTGPGYVFVDHGEEFRRQHAEAFPVKATGITIASSEWAIDHLQKNGGSGYLPRRHVREQLAFEQWTIVEDAPVFGRRVYVVEAIQTVRSWEWYEGAIAALAGR